MISNCLISKTFVFFQFDVELKSSIMAVCGLYGAVVKEDGVSDDGEP